MTSGFLAALAGDDGGDRPKDDDAGGERPPTAEGE